VWGVKKQPAKIIVFLPVFNYIKMSKPLEIKDDMEILLQQQPNVITMARHRYNLFQMRILLRIVEALQKDMTMETFSEIRKTSLGDTVVKIKASSLLKNQKGDKNHLALRKAVEEMTKKGVVIEVKKDSRVVKEIYTNIVKKGSYAFREKFIELEIDRDVLPAFLSLAAGYTRYNLKVALSAPTTTCSKIYQYISRFRDKKQITVKFETLRKLLLIEDKYKYPKDFVRFILKPAIDTLKKTGDVYFSIKERLMSGSKLIGWIFEIHHTTQENHLKKITPLPLPQAHFSTRRGDNCYEILTNAGFSPRQATEIVIWAEKKRKIISLTKLLSDFLNKQNKSSRTIDDKPAYIAKILRENEIKVDF